MYCVYCPEFQVTQSFKGEKSNGSGLCRGSPGPFSPSFSAFEVTTKKKNSKQEWVKYEHSFQILLAGRALCAIGSELSKESLFRKEDMDTHVCFWYWSRWGRNETGIAYEAWLLIRVSTHTWSMGNIVQQVSRFFVEVILGISADRELITANLSYKGDLPPSGWAL